MRVAIHVLVLLLLAFARGAAASESPGIADALASIAVPLDGGESWAHLNVGGVPAAAFDAQPRLRVIAGRPFKPESHEMMVEEKAYERFPTLRLGGKVVVGGAIWQIVGVFRSGFSHQPELLCDAAVLTSALRAQ